MRVHVSGSSGWIGRFVVARLKQTGHIVVDDPHKEPDALIHLAWERHPFNHPYSFDCNVDWNDDYLHRAVELGIRNITIAGTCLETLPKLTWYALAKLKTKEFAQAILPEVKWVRLWYLYGEGQRPECLLPRLQLARKRLHRTFSIIDGERDFVSVSYAAEKLVDIATQMRVTGEFDCCTGKAESVRSFCERHSTPGSIEFVTDYPMPHYEPRSFHGNPDRMLSI